MGPYGMNGSIMLDPEKLNKLALQYDPAPILKELGGSVDGEGNFTPQFPQAGPGAPQAPYMNMLGQATESMMPGDQPPVQQAGAAPLDPRSLAMINSLMPKDNKQPYAPATAPRTGAQVKIDIPDVGSILNRTPRGQVPSLSSLFGGR